MLIDLMFHFLNFIFLFICHFAKTVTFHIFDPQILHSFGCDSAVGEMLKKVHPLDTLIVLACYSNKTPFDAFEYHVFENIMENGAFALLEQMLHFP